MFRGGSEDQQCTYSEALTAAAFVSRGLRQKAPQTADNQTREQEFEDRVEGQRFVAANASGENRWKRFPFALGTG